MDVASLSQAIGLFSAVITALKQVINLIPDNAKKEEAQVSLAEAEKQLKIAEATLATELGYEICRNHFPPGIMLSQDGENWECPECHSKRNIKKRLFGAKWAEL